MIVPRLFKLLLAVLVSAGLTIAPLATPAMAEHAMAGKTMQMADMPDMPDMVSDMPCCPDQQDNKGNDCGSCPLVALCMLTITMPAPDSAGALLDRTFSRKAFALPDDLLIDG